MTETALLIYKTALMVREKEEGYVNYTIFVADTALQATW
jgi:hypothetical protein